jgi:hypothetical protein
MVPSCFAVEGVGGRGGGQTQGTVRAVTTMAGCTRHRDTFGPGVSSILRIHGLYHEGLRERVGGGRTHHMQRSARSCGVAPIDCCITQL